MARPLEKSGPLGTQSLLWGKSFGQLLCHGFAHLVLEIGALLPFRLKFHPLIVWDLGEAVETSQGRWDPRQASRPEHHTPGPQILKEEARARAEWVSKRPPLGQCSELQGPMSKRDQEQL